MVFSHMRKSSVALCATTHLHCSVRSQTSCIHELRGTCTYQTKSWCGPFTRPQTLCVRATTELHPLSLALAYSSAQGYINFNLHLLPQHPCRRAEHHMSFPIMRYSTSIAWEYRACTSLCVIQPASLGSTTLARRPQLCITQPVSPGSTICHKSRPIPRDPNSSLWHLDLERLMPRWAHYNLA